MTRKNIQIIASLLIGGLALCCTANAAQLGTYVGGGIGYSKRDYDAANLDENRDAVLEQLSYTTLDQGATSTDASDLTYWATLGYRASPHWAFEGTYSKLSSLQYTSVANDGFVGPPGGTTFPGPSHLKFDVEDTALQIDVLYIIPRGYRWEFYGRGGFAITNTRTTARIEDPVGVYKPEVSTSSNTYHAGIGFAYSLLEVYGIRVEYNHVFSVAAHSLGGQHDVDALTLGIIVAF